MKKSYKISLGLLLLVFVLQSAFAQKIVQLPLPSKMNVVEGGSTGGNNDVGTIYYGSVPANSSTKPVLVFIHGYNSSAKTWWEDNDMYSKAYADGYRTAFVSVHPDQTMWTNGQLFAGMLNTITTYFGVSRVVVIAHSKGGVDTDAALIHYGAWNKVERVLTLGSPHFGTPLADLASSGWTSWLGAIFGQNNNATKSLQTGTMAAFRNQTDPHPNRPKTNVKTYGGWNYSGWLWVSGVYLSWNGGSSSQGGNDGVVNYNSTKRPNAAVILGVKDSRGKVNHSEIATGSKMWQHILPQLPSSLARELDTPVETKRYNPTAIVSSAAEFVSADKGSRSISINAKGKVKISIYQMDEDPTFFLSAKGNVSVGMPERKENNSSFIEAEQDGKVVYTFKSKKPYFVVAETEEKIVATLRSDLNDDKFVYEQGESMNFKIALEGDNIQEVTGSLLRTSNLEGEADQTNIASAITFERNGKYFVATQAGNLPTGVYNVAVQVKGEKVNRSIVTSIAVVAAQEKVGVIPKQFAGLGAYPNPSQGATTIHFEIQKKGNNHIRIYNLIGELVYQADLSNLEEGKHQIVWQAESRLKNGIYIYELESNGSKQSKKLVFNR